MGEGVAMNDSSLGARLQEDMTNKDLLSKRCLTTVLDVSQITIRLRGV